MLWSVPIFRSGLISWFGKISVAFFTLSLMTANVFARPATDDETKALQQTIETITPLMQKDDIDAIMGSMPPSIPTQLSKIFEGNSADAIREATRQTLIQMYKQAKTESWLLDFEKKQACEFDDGTPCFVLPLTQRIAISGKKIRIIVPLIAVMENGKWYFVNTAEKPQTEILQKVYPGIEKVKTAAPIMEELN